jgi:hypothetical protein
VEFARAVLHLLPPRLHANPRSLIELGRPDAAELEEFHRQLDVAVRRLRRLARRAAVVLSERVAHLEGEFVPAGGDDEPR